MILLSFTECALFIVGKSSLPQRKTIPQQRAKMWEVDGKKKVTLLCVYMFKMLTQVCFNEQY